MTTAANHQLLLSIRQALSAKYACLSRQLGSTGSEMIDIHRYPNDTFESEPPRYPLVLDKDGIIAESKDKHVKHPDR
jgi:hypothetical protein